LRHVVMFSGGVGSWAAAKRVVERHGTHSVLLLFTDTLMEDADLYRFLGEVESRLDVPLLRLVEGRNPWQVYFDERFIGNSRVDPCSKILKRQMADRWLTENCDPADTTVYVGIDWSEEHRYTRLRERRLPWRYEAPMCEPPYLTRQMMLDALRADGIEPPRLYAHGFAHNNCGGFCCKAGQGHFATLLREFPKRYAFHEAMEEMLRQWVGGDQSILRDRRNGESVPLTLRQLRERIETGQQPDLFDIGGCGCFVDVPADATAAREGRE
jgi:hypothetical protein